ncbi:MAG TPA: TldD/PmbA family protein [Chloroflexota bacterium]|nr:TldD/PmbA family protein [Chloroflexota bacterium]
MATTARGTAGAGVEAADLQTIAEQVLSLVKSRVEQAEVYAYETASTPVDFEANRLKSLETKESRGLALRVVKDGRIGLAATTRLNDPTMLVDQAVELAAFGALARFELPGAIDSSEVNVYDAAAEALTVEQMVALGEEMIERIRAYDSEILCEAGIRRVVETTLILNSRGGSGRYKKSSFACIVGGQLIRGEDFLNVWEYDSACGPRIDQKELAEKAIRKFELSKTVVTAHTRRQPVIFTPRGVAGILWGPMAAALSGKSVYQGSSALSDKLGQQVFDPRLTITEDSTVSGVPSSAPFDDEGVPTRRLPLIDRGAVANFYYDLQTAGLAGKESTGNGYRSPESLPGPHTGTIFFEPGDVAFEKMVGGIEEGLIVESVTGNAGNVFSGDFSGNIQGGFKIEKGKIAGRVKDTMVAGNIFQDMKQLGGIADVAEWVYGQARIPHLLFAELGVSTTS